MAYEDTFLGNIDRNRSAERFERKNRIGNSIETLIPQEYESARRYLKHSAIRIGDFRDLYGSENIERDISEANRLKHIFQRNDRKEFHEGLNFGDVVRLSEITESYLLRGINESKWIPYCTGIKTSDYDDYTNGVDIVLEYQKDDSVASHVGLGIDVTFAASLDEKLKGIKRDIETGSLVNLKYFDSPKSHIRGQLKQVPRCIVAFDLPTIERLAQQRNSAGKLSETDPTRLIALHQLNMQFRTYVEYAEKIKSPTLATLQRTSKFIDLLTRYVQQSVSNQSAIIRESAQISQLSRKLEVFGDLK